MTNEASLCHFPTLLYQELEVGMIECSTWFHDQAREINRTVHYLEQFQEYVDFFESCCNQNRVK